MRLSKRELEVLEMALTSADDIVVAANLHMNSPKQVSVHKTRVRRKIAQCKAFLRAMRKYKDVLFPEKRYKGLKVK